MQRVFYNSICTDTPFEKILTFRLAQCTYGYEGHIHKQHNNVQNTHICQNDRRGRAHLLWAPSHLGIPGNKKVDQ